MNNYRMALHEASHGCYAIAEGLPLSRIHIRPQQSIDGDAIDGAAVLTKAWREVDMLKLGVFHLIGAVVSRRLAGDGAWQPESAADLPTAEKILRAATRGHPPFDELWEAAVIIAEAQASILDRQIKRVADAFCAGASCRRRKCEN